MTNPLAALTCSAVDIAKVGPNGRGWTIEPFGKCGDCRLVFGDPDLTYNYGADDWLCPNCTTESAPVNHCRITGCAGISYHPGGNCPDCNRALARLGRSY